MTATIERRISRGARVQKQSKVTSTIKVNAGWQLMEYKFWTSAGKLAIFCTNIFIKPKFQRLPLNREIE